LGRINPRAISRRSVTGEMPAQVIARFFQFECAATLKCVTSVIDLLVYGDITYSEFVG